VEENVEEKGQQSRQGVFEMVSWNLMVPDLVRM